MGKTVLSRRTVLRGVAGGVAVSLGLPILEAMLNGSGTALADGSSLPCRFMTFMFGNGVRLDRWTPTATGAGYALTEELAPLANVRDYCSVLSGFRQNLPGANGHDNGRYGSFSGWRGEYYDLEDPLASRPTGPSVDAVAADSIGGDTFLRSLQVGNSKRTPGGSRNAMSFRGPNQPNPPMFNPQDVYDRLFVGPTESDQFRARMLDAVVDDAQSLRTRLGRADRERLDLHLDGIADLERRITAVPPACDAPPVPTETNTDIGGQEPLVEVAEAMADLIAVAFSCDLVRVVAFQQSGSVCQSIYAMTGSNLDNHGQSHEGTAQAQEFIHQAVLINMQAFAYLLEALQNTPEGAGNVLDNCVILLGSDVAEGLSHSNVDMPFIVAGGAGGRLRTPGVHHRDPNRNASDILLTCLRAIDPGIESVGDGQGFSTTAVSQIEA